MSTIERPVVSFDPGTHSVRIARLSITDSAVTTEAFRWSTGRRGQAVSAEELASADLTAFVSQALVVGSRAITCAGGIQETFELERLVADVAARTEAASTQAAEITGLVARTAVDAVGQAAGEVRKTLAEAEASSRKAYAETVASVTATLRADIERIVGGDRPELLDKLAPMLESVSRKVSDQALKQTDELLGKVSRQFDPADPTSPFAKQASLLAEQQNALGAAIQDNQLALVSKVDELARAVEIQRTAAAAAARTASLTPLKGGSFEAAINAVMAEIAAGLGDEYVETGGVTGAIQRCYKGDGVLTIAGCTAKVALEMQDSAERRSWNAYLDEAERNRQASASIGVVRTAAQNGGQTIRVLGARRVILAFDPSGDDADLLRTVVQMVRLSAIASASRRDADGLETAREHLWAAGKMIDGINTIRKASGVVRKSADSIDRECNTVQSGVERHLAAALDALAGATADPDGTAATNCIGAVPSTGAA